MFPFHSRDKQGVEWGDARHVFLLKTLGNRVFKKGCAEGLKDARNVDHIVGEY